MTDTPRDEPGLFDLPLEAPPPSILEEMSEEEAPSPRKRAPRSGARPESMSLFDDEERDEESASTSGTELDAPHALPNRFALRPRGEIERAEASHSPRRLAVPSRPTAPPARAPGFERDSATAPLVARLLGSGGDLVVVGAAGAVAALGARSLGAPIGVAELGPLALFLFAWSFVYFVVPLAFWGATPGMSWAGLVARTSATEPLSFGQAAMRWLGTWLTWASLGLGGLLALSGRSLADRVSGSSTHPQAA